MLARALKAIGGSGDAQRLKVFLVGTDLVPLKEWNVFWRQARARPPEAPPHRRLAGLRAVLPPARRGEAAPTPAAAVADAPLPALAVGKPARANLTTLRKFLSQHPAAEPALTQRFGRFIQRTMLDEEGERVDRARAGLYFARWYPERAADWTAVLEQLWEQGLAVTDLSGEAEQLALLAVSHAPGVESDAILSALDSRFSAVREEAARLLAQLDDDGRADLRRTLLLHAARYPGAALRSIEDELRAPVPRPTAGSCCGRRWRCSRTGPSARSPRRCCAGSSRGVRSSRACSQPDLPGRGCSSRSGCWCGNGAPATGCCSPRSTRWTTSGSRRRRRSSAPSGRSGPEAVPRGRATG